MFIGSDTDDVIWLDAGATLTFETQDKPYGLNDSLDLDRSEDDNANIAQYIDSSSVMSPVIVDGVIPFSAGEELIFNRIWIDPNVINPAFTTEDTNYNVEVWNAYLTEESTWTAENIAGDTEGVNFARDGLPITLGASEAKVYVMTLYREGPASQDTTYTETIRGDDYDIDITTLRILWLNPEPNWVERVHTGYNFETVVAVNDRHFEQRRPLRHDIRRTLKIELHANGHELHILSNTLQFGHDKVFACPIYQERILCATIPNGASTIVTTTDIATHWNLNNACNYIMIADHAAGDIEIKEISSIGAYSIVTTQDIVGSFNVNSTIVYPVFLGVLTSHSIQHETNTIAVIKLEFQEFISG